MINNIHNGSMTHSIARNRTTARGVNLPEIPKHILTSGRSNLSDDRFKDKIWEMAQRDVAAGRNSRFVPNGCTVGSDEWRSLLNDFISVASPDRIGIINNTLSGLAGRLGQMMARINLRANLLTLLMGNSRFFGNKDIGNNFINFRDASGNVIAMFQSDTGWSNVSTPAENGRAQEFFRLWDESFALASEKHHFSKFVIDSKKNGIAIDLAERIARGQNFDMAKLAAAGITLDPETGQTVVNMRTHGGIVSVNVSNGKEVN